LRRFRVEGEGLVMKPRSYLVLALLACAILYWALYLSASDRGIVDWIVIAAVIAAIVWNLIRLGRRLHAVGGARAVWHEMRTVVFWILGLTSTVWARPGARGSWTWWVGMALLVLALADSIVLYRKERRSASGSGG